MPSGLHLKSLLTDRGRLGHLSIDFHTQLAGGCPWVHLCLREVSPVRECWIKSLGREEERFRNRHPGCGVPVLQKCLPRPLYGGNPGGSRGRVQGINSTW